MIRAGFVMMKLPHQNIADPDLIHAADCIDPVEPGLMKSVLEAR